MSVNNRPVGSPVSGDESREHSNEPESFEEMAAAARSRLAAQAPDEVQRLPPEAIASLSPGSNPVTRYLDGRNARSESVAGYLRKLSRSRQWLITAGMDKRLADVPLETFPWHCVDEAIAQSFTLLLQNHYASGKSRENLIGAVRRILRECTAVGLLSRDDRDRALECLKARVEPRRRAGREVKEAEIHQLFAATVAGGRPIDLRDAAIIAVFQCTGLRASDVSEIDADGLDLDPDQRSALVKRTKSGHGRVVWLSPFAVEVVSNWLAVRGDHPGGLFDSLQRRGKPLSPIRLNNIIKERAEKAGLRNSFTSHDFRRTLATRALRSGTDVFTVQRLLDHKNVQTTLTYDRRTEIEDRAVVDGLELLSLTITRQPR